MPEQASVRLPVTTVDLGRFVKFEPASSDQHYRVGGEGGRRSGEIGLCAGTIGLRHSSGYEVLLQFADGSLDSFRPHDLFPIVDEVRA